MEKVIVRNSIGDILRFFITMRRMELYPEYKDVSSSICTLYSLYKQIGSIYSFSAATHSISTSEPMGRPATLTHVRA
jgi:hypothetical protein